MSGRYSRPAVATTIYIDGFNLYYGALRNTPHKWLDVEALCRRLLPKDDINRIRYFTARITARPDDPQQAQRQETYLRALRTLPLVSIHYGHFLTHPVRLPLANPRPSGPRTAEVFRTEEKGSDVNLASHLLLDAFQKNCETAVVVSNDSDPSSAHPHRRTRARDQSRHHQPASTRIPFPSPTRHLLQTAPPISPRRLSAARDVGR